MEYNQAKQQVFANGSVPDGYFGDRKQCGFSFDPESGKTLVIYDHGFFTAPIPPAIDQTEALWLLKNHPNAKNIKIK